MNGLEEVTGNLIWNLIAEQKGVDVFELHRFLEHIATREICPIGAKMVPLVDENRCRSLVASAFTTMFRSGALRMQTDGHTLVIVALEPPREVC